MPRIGLLVSFIFVLAACSENNSQSADLIFHNARVVTADSDFNIVQAIAIVDGKIFATGSNEEILALNGEQTIVTDLNDQMILPGLIDTHQHVLSPAMSEFDHPIPSMITVADVLEYITSRANVIPEGEWIWVRDVFPTRLQEYRYPSRAEMDNAAPNHPVIFAPFDVSPVVSVNSMALAILGIDRNFQPEFSDDILRDDDGEPTGIIKNHQRYIDDDGRQMSTAFQDRRSQYLNMTGIYNSVGFTTIVDRNAAGDVADFYKTIVDSGDATVRISFFHTLDSSQDIPDIQNEIKRIAQLPLHIEKDPLIQLIGVKTYSDGGILSGSSYMLEPWGINELYQISDPAYRGKLFNTSERLTQMIIAAVNEGLQFTSHAVGDGAVNEVVEAYVEAAKSVPVKGSRASVTHSNFMSAYAIENMAELDIVADVQPFWLYLDSNALISHFGYDRLRYFQPLQSLFNAGVVVAGGSDHWLAEDPNNATNPFNPFLGMWIAMAREARYVDEAIYPEESLNLQQALQMYTLNAAYALSREQDLGSLEAGKLADFVVIDRDILNSTVDDIRDTRVLQTYLGGELVYQRE
jgi:predicted amidohydrolase YtcJ